MVVTQASAMDNEQELANAENQLRAMLSPDTPVPTSADVRAMKKKIAALKNRSSDQEHATVVVTQISAMDNEQEIARAENRLRAMLSPDTPAPSSAEVRAMRKKIANLKNPQKKRPSDVDMRAELLRLQAEHKALLQFKELELENLKLRGKIK